MDKLAYTIEQVVNITGVGRSTVYNAIKSGQLEARKHGRRTWITSAALNKWIESMPMVRSSATK